MKVLLTGASGFLGIALIPKLIARGDTVYGLSRHPPVASKGLVPIIGDITELGLGLKDPPHVDAVYHLAAIHNLGEDKDGNIWKTNVLGTKNVINFCLNNCIPQLFFCSTAYTRGRNPYERSKGMCESMVTESTIPHVTIFKPSVVMGTKEYPYPGHFSQWVMLTIRVHKRAELIRRKMEGTLRLPILSPVFRVKGDSEGTLNMITVDDVVGGMINVHREGVVWLTHPNPPTLGQLVMWIGEFALLDVKMLPHFKPTPIELAFQRLSLPFEPYLHGDNFPSDVDCAPITREFVHDTIAQALLTIDKR